MNASGCWAWSESILQQLNQRRPIPSSRRPRARWTTLDWAASLSLSAFWHLLVLAVLALAVHPFQLPDASRTVDLELLPPLTPPPTPSVEIELRPREPEPRPAPAPNELRPAPPEAPRPVKAPEAQPVTPPLEAARPAQPALANPIDVQRRSVQASRLQTQQAAPVIPQAPPEPVTVTRPTAALPPSIEAPRAQAPRRSGPLDTTRPAPDLPQAPPVEAEAPASNAPSVLTNSAVIQAPVEIRPRERPAAAPPLDTQGAAPDIPSAAAGGGAAGGQAAPGGAAGGARSGPPSSFAGVNGAFGSGLKGGLRTGIGCADPDAYRLTAEERAACLDRLGQQARNAPYLGPNIPARKQAEYDHDVACHRAYAGASIPGSNAPSDGTSIPGMGSNPSLKECGPGER